MQMFGVAVFQMELIIWNYDYRFVFYGINFHFDVLKSSLSSPDATADNDSQIQITISITPSLGMFMQFDQILPNLCVYD